MASVRVLRSKSSISWRVTTEIDCGVSRMLKLSLVAVLVEPVV